MCPYNNPLYNPLAYPASYRYNGCGGSNNLIYNGWYNNNPYSNDPLVTGLAAGYLAGNMASRRRRRCCRY